MERSSHASVLIADDTVESLRMLSEMLTAEGYEVRPVTSGGQALQAAEHTPPDLILLDVGMPEMDGFEVCARMKASEKLRDVSVLFLTALTDTASKVRAFEVGGADYITKPFQLEEVLARVKVHVMLHDARTQLQRQLEQLSGLEQLRDDLVHMVVHDMRSPLTGLMTHLSFVADDGADRLTDDSKEDLQVAQDCAAAIDRMANDLLDVRRLEEGKLPLQRATTDLVQLAREGLTVVGLLDRTRHIEVDGASPVMVGCDPKVVQRVFENLISNAIKHTPSGGTIRVNVSRQGAQARAVVIDEGFGVPEAARPRLFEKFGGVGARKDSKYHSAGLGLAFCKLAVEAHGGKIGVRPGVPRGSEFWFELPA